MRISLFCLLFLALTSAHAELYKWVDASGKVHFSDQPPPKSVGEVEKKDLTTVPTTQVSDLPYVLAVAVRNHPVTLYTTRNCLPCDEGRVLLKKRGIPFAEKTVNTNADIMKMKEVSGDNGLPLLVVGASKMTGYDASRWETMLTLAGYPKTSQLPNGYQFSSARPVAPEKQADVTKEQTRPELKPKELETELKPAQGNAPEGFRF